MEEAEPGKRSRLGSADSGLTASGMSSSASSCADSDAELDVLAGGLLFTTSASPAVSDDADSCPSVHGDGARVLLGDADWAVLGGLAATDAYALDMGADGGLTVGGEEELAALARSGRWGLGLDGDAWDAGLLQLL